MVAMQRLCGDRVRDLIAPRLEAALVETLGPPRSAASWLSLEQDALAQSPTLYFGYPAQETDGMSYIRRNVKLELGSLTDQQPVGRHEIRPWVADAFPALFTAWHCEVVALDLPRSFWEGATILHAEYHRPEDQPFGPLFTALCGCRPSGPHLAAASFLADEAMCVRIADWKSQCLRGAGRDTTWLAPGPCGSRLPRTGWKLWLPTTWRCSHVCGNPRRFRM